MPPDRSAARWPSASAAASGMEPGYLGEPVSRFDGTKTAYILAQRRPGCRLVLARY